MPSRTAVRPQVFISHTDAQDADARAFRAKLSKALKVGGFDPVLDDELLHPGDEWRRKLLVLMLGCHAGLILVSKKALEGEGRPWMQFETTVLVMLRVRSQIAGAPGTPPFPIIPLAVPPFKPEDVDKTWLEPLALGEVQGGRASAALIKEIVASLKRTGLREKLADTPLQGLQSVIRPWLRKVDLEVLCDTGTALEADTTTWSLDDAPDRLAVELLKADLVGVRKAMDKLAPQMPEAGELLKILAAGWVDPEAAAKLPPISRSARPIVGINGREKEFTGNTYVRRAWARYPAPRMVYITDSGERDAEGAVHEVLSEVRRSYPHKERSSDQEVIDFLAVIADDTAFHVVLPWLPEARTIQALTSRLPNATFLCFPARDESQERTDSTLEFLAPEIDQARETNALDLYEATKSLIESP